MPDHTKTARGGLFTAGHDHAPVPLTGVSIEGEIHGFFARVVVAQRYVNRESSAIEAVYVFPLDEAAAVCGFEAVVDGTLVVGEVRDRDEAFDVYDDAMADGHGAFLLDEERPDVFQASIGNLLPGKEVLVRVTYVTELSVDAGQLRFVIPTTVSPRYAPADDRTVGRPEGEALNPPTAFTVPYGLTLSVAVTVPGGITAVESPSHPIALKLAGEKATISLAQGDAALDRDFVLSVEAPAFRAPIALVERTDDEEVVGVALTPTFEGSGQVPAEVIFIVDRSGSMAGTSINEARNALQLCLRSMTPDCRFNIIGFGTKIEWMFENSRPYTKENVEIASTRIASMVADLGGTEILKPLQLAFAEPAVPGLTRQIVVVTDGEVTNTDQVLGLASTHAAEARIFTIGVGAGASRHLVRGLARVGRGAAEFIYPGERIEPKMLRQFRRMLSPALTDVSVEWIGGTVTQAPMQIPTVFPDGRLAVYGFVKDARPSAVRLKATGPSGTLSFEVPITADADASLRSVAPLAARARIRELEEGNEWLYERGSRQTGRRAGAVRREIVGLSTRYGIISRDTSYVAVERRQTPAIGAVELRRVPIALTSGWGGRMQVPTAAPRMAAQGGLERLFGGRSRSVPERASGGEGSVFYGFDQGISVEGVTTGLREGTDRKGAEERLRQAVQTLIKLQEVDGSWELTPDFASAIGVRFHVVLSEVPNDSDVQRVWATALALAWLDHHAAALRPEWQMLAAKAQWWIDNPPLPALRGRRWLDVAREKVM